MGKQHFVVVNFLAATVINLAAAFPAMAFEVSVSVRAWGNDIESVGLTESPFIAEARSENEPHWAEARVDLGTGRLEAGAKVVQPGNQHSSSGRASYRTRLDIRNPALPNNTLIDMQHNFVLSGSMRVREGGSLLANNLSSVSIWVDGPGWDDNVLYGWLKLRSFLDGFPTGRAYFYARTDQFTPNNIWAEEDGSRRILGTVTEVSDGYYTLSFSIPARFVIEGTRVNATGDSWNPYPFHQVTIAAVAEGDGIADFRASLAYAEQNPMVPDPGNPDIPLTGWTFTTVDEFEGWERPTWQGPLTLETATGSGTAALIAGGGTILEESLAAVGLSDLPVPPPEADFVHGFFELEFAAAEDVLDEALTLTVALPDVVDDGTRWYYLDQSDQWQVISLAGSIDGRSLTIPLNAGQLTEAGSMNLLGGPGVPPPTIFGDRFEELGR